MNSISILPLLLALSFLLPSSDHSVIQQVDEVVEKNDYEDHFDSKTNDDWRECHPLMNEIPEQSAKCGDCWAHAVAASTASRYCIHTKGTFKKSFSTLDLLECTQRRVDDKCSGGSLSLACLHYANHNAVTGSTSKSRKTGCKPYPFSICNPARPEPDCPPGKKNYTVGKCLATCSDPTLDYASESISKMGSCLFLNHGYFKKTEEAVMHALKSNGPIVADIEVTKKFKKYTGGIFEQPKGPKEKVQQHVVQLTGWGVENGKVYWIGTNSWGTGWGEKGHFRILRGANMLNIETRIAALIIKGADEKPPSSSTIFYPIERNAEMLDCFSIDPGFRCPEGFKATLLSVTVVDFACFPANGEISEKLKALMQQHNEINIYPYEFKGTAQKIRQPVWCKRMQAP